jgi:class 3 adenylate cyclase
VTAPSFPVVLAIACGVGLIAAVRRQRALARAYEERHLRTTRALEHLQLAFSRFAPGKVVDQIAHAGLAVTAEHRDVTVLFADLRGFTSMSEDLDPEVLVGILNGYFARMSGAISSNNGHVSKFIGDGILACFGALGHNPWQTDDAVRAALAMRAAMADYNAELAARGLPALHLSVGIHYGRVVAGVVGSEELVEFTVIGRTVNLAARVEGLTRTFDVDVLVTDAVRERVSPSFRLREMAPVPVKGIAAPVPTWFVEG